MRIARVIGNLTLGRRLDGFPAGSLLLVDALDGAALDGLAASAVRQQPMPESLVVFDELGAGIGQLIGVSEGREASMPFWPRSVPLDAYNAAILDEVEWKR